MENHAVLQLDMIFTQCSFNLRAIAPWCTWNRLEEGGDSIYSTNREYGGPSSSELPPTSGSLISLSHCVTHISLLIFVCLFVYWLKTFISNQTNDLYQNRHLFSNLYIKHTQTQIPVFCAMMQAMLGTTALGITQSNLL